MSTNYYEIMDPDEQATNYPLLLCVWSPDGRMFFAIERIEISEAHVAGYNAEGGIVATFHRSLPYMVCTRKVVKTLTEEETWERGLEAAQVDKMRKERAAKVLNPSDDRRYM